MTKILSLSSAPAKVVLDELVVLAPHPPVVQVGLRGVDGDHDGFVEVQDRVPLPEEPLEVDVADVARVVVAGDHHDPLAMDAPDVLGRLLELLTVTGVRQVARHHDSRGIEVVDLEDRTLQQVGYEVGTTAVDVADLTDNHPAPRAHTLPDSIEWKCLEKYSSTLRPCGFRLST